MGLRFRKSIKLMPGVRLNFGLKSASISIGASGATYNVGSRSSRVTMGIPGSGLSYSANIAPPSQASVYPAVLPKRRFSLTALAVILLVLGVVYVIATGGNKTSQQTPPVIASPELRGIVAAPQVQQVEATSIDPVPIPRPRPKPTAGVTSQPLQITPSQRRE